MIDIVKPQSIKQELEGSTEVQTIIWCIVVCSSRTSFLLPLAALSRSGKIPLLLESASVILLKGTIYFMDYWS